MVVTQNFLLVFRSFGNVLFAANALDAVSVQDAMLAGAQQSVEFMSGGERVDVVTLRVRSRRSRAEFGVRLSHQQFEFLQRRFLDRAREAAREISAAATEAFFANFGAELERKLAAGVTAEEDAEGAEECCMAGFYENLPFTNISP